MWVARPRGLELRRWSASSEGAGLRVSHPTCYEASSRTLEVRAADFTSFMICNGLPRDPAELQEAYEPRTYDAINQEQLAITSKPIPLILLCPWLGASANDCLDLLE